jgi:putative ABC transport system ATP-binding protein
MNQPAIVLEDVRRDYPGGVHALDGVSLRIGAGEWAAVMGPSGSGKTTLLNLVDGLDRPTAGRVVVLGRETGAFAPGEATVFRRENIGLIFQQFHLIPYLTALENVMLAQYYHSLVDKAQAMQALEAVQLTERAHHLPSQLSGGEQQRVCVARALINDPQIVLADEPTANLDEANEAKVFDILRALHAQGRTIVVATHDPALGALAQRRILLRRGRLVHDEPARAGESGRAAAPMACSD